MPGRERLVLSVKAPPMIPRRGPVARRFLGRSHATGKPHWQCPREAGGESAFVDVVAAKELHPSKFQRRASLFSARGNLQWFRAVASVLIASLHESEPFMANPLPPKDTLPRRIS